MGQVMELTTEQLREYARIGAQLELQRIYKLFPELRRAMREESAQPTEVETVNGKRSMSAEARKKISKRMRRYWAKKRKAQQN